MLVGGILSCAGWELPGQVTTESPGPGWLSGPWWRGQGCTRPCGGRWGAGSSSRPGHAGHGVVGAVLSHRRWLPPTGMASPALPLSSLLVGRSQGQAETPGVAEHVQGRDRWRLHPTAAVPLRPAGSVPGDRLLQPCAPSHAAELGPGLARGRSGQSPGAGTGGTAPPQQINRERQAQL